MMIARHFFQIPERDNTPRATRRGERNRRESTKVQARRPEQLVMTKGDVPPPPDPTVPEPSGIPTGIDPETLHEVKSLADRIGGLEKLRDLVDALLRLQR